MTSRTQSNLRTLKSRNQREGWYAGKKRFYYLPFGESKPRKHRSKGAMFALLNGKDMP